jgi:hypothetical protein
LHQLSVTHRDIKPSNIKVQKDGVVKLIDFGIAKGVTSPTITASGQTIGTLDYMSPERLDGRHTVQSDIWSLGVLLYEMITGKNPFKARDEFTMRKSISKGEYVRIENFPQISDSDVKVGGIITKCLQINPAKRFRNGKELEEAVNRFIRHGSLVRVGRPGLGKFPAPGKITLAIAGVASLALIVILLTTGNGGAPAGQNSRAEKAASPAQVELVITTNTTGPAAVILPDGKRCPTPCTITREQGTEINVQIVADGFKPYSASLQFRKNDRKTFTLRRN